MINDVIILEKKEKKLNEYRIKNEILFVLNCAEELDWEPLGRKNIQKIIYLTHTLAPLKEIIISYLNFYKYYYGPYTHEIQNALDNLIALGLVELVSLKYNSKENSIASQHRISEDGKKVIEKLIPLKDNQERHDWIKTIMRLIKIYGLENLVDMVYQEPTFKTAKYKGTDKHLKIENKSTNLSMELINFLRKHGAEKFGYDTKNLELILISFFDYLYSEHETKKARAESI